MSAGEQGAAPSASILGCLPHLHSCLEIIQVTSFISSSSSSVPHSSSGLSASFSPIMFLHLEEEKEDFEERMMERRVEIYRVEVSCFLFLISFPIAADLTLG